MKMLLGSIRIHLSEIQKKFEGVVADLKIVGILSLNATWRWILALIAFISHQQPASPRFKSTAVRRSPSIHLRGTAIAQPNRPTYAASEIPAFFQK
jgi:hypothetical protein